MPADALNQGALAEELSAMDVQRKEEQTAAQSALVPGPPPAVDDRGDDRFDLTLNSVNGSQARVAIRLKAMPRDQHNVVISLTRNSQPTSS